MIAHPNRILPSTDNALEAPVESEYAKQYSEASFWRKLRRFARTAGREVTEKSLFLYYAVQDPAMPAWAKAVVYGSLGYFILPADAIPDVFPGVGFTDDLGALAAAVAIVIAHITPEVRAKARRQLRQWFESPDAT